MSLPKLPLVLLRRIPSSTTNSLMRKNALRIVRNNPNKERESRKGETLLPIQEINKKWWDHPLGGRMAHRNVGKFNKYFHVRLETWSQKINLSDTGTLSGLRY